MRSESVIDYDELVHVGPGTLGGQYWRRFWHPIYRAADLPAGRAIPLTILGERFTLYREEAGAGVVASPAGRGRRSAAEPGEGGPPATRAAEAGVRPHPRPLPEGEGRTPAPSPPPSPPMGAREFAAFPSRLEGGGTPQFPSPLAGEGEGRFSSPLAGEGAGGGAPHLVAFRCAHRGTQLSVGWVEDDCIRCRYHGWMYGPDGQCVEQPGEDPGAAERVRIRAYPTREYVGLIFAYLGDDPTPPFRSYPDLDQPGVVVTDPPEELPTSFWNRIDNDAAHGAWTHRASAIRMNRPDFLIQRIDAIEETPYGYIQRREGFSSGHIFMPNGRLFWIKTRARGYEGRSDLVDTKFSWTVPIDDTHFVAFDVTVSPLEGEEARKYAAQRAREQEPEAEVRWDIAEEILAGRLTIDEMPEDVSHYNGFAIEDYVTQVGQGPFPDRAHERLGRIDARVVINRRLWIRELTALAEGKPLTDWRVPDEPLRPPPGTRFV